MTGYESKCAAAQDKLDDDDIQIYQKPWIGLTKEEKQKCVNESVYHTAWSSDIDIQMLIENVIAMLKEKNA